MAGGTHSQAVAHLCSEPLNAGMVGGMLRWDGNGSLGVAGETGASGMKGFGSGFSSAEGTTLHRLLIFRHHREFRI